MPQTAQTDPEFEFKVTPEIEEPAAIQALAAPTNPLGPLAHLVGEHESATWAGTGFNTIWRPHTLAGGGQDRFLELNITSEKLVFTKIKGKIPNRGLLMPDINMVGLTYMQQIAEKDDPAQGLHIEPGIWVNVPHTTNPAEPPTVVRMASIPHGTAILAQGTGKSVNGGPQIGDNNIIPFPIGSPPPPDSEFASASATFTELHLATPTQFRQASPGVTQAMVKNPNSVLQKAIAGQDIKSTTVLAISTKHMPIKGGGTANTAFLEAASSPPGGNAQATQVDATFWIETVADDKGGPDKLQLQYTQLVQLDFNGLRWPHVTVATLQKQ
jgi:hypothetical protein